MIHGLKRSFPHYWCCCHSKLAENQKGSPRKKFYLLTFLSLSADDNQEGVLDGLMEALNTGSAFRDPSRPVRKKAPGGKKGESST